MQDGAVETILMTTVYGTKWVSLPDQADVSTVWLVGVKSILVVVGCNDSESRSCKYRNNEPAAPRLRQGSTTGVEIAL